MNYEPEDTTGYDEEMRESDSSARQVSGINLRPA